MTWMMMLALLNTPKANEQAISIGFGNYYGGIGVAYNYSPTVGLGFQIGAGPQGLALGVRWDPDWMYGGYAQAGLSRTYTGALAPNMVVGGTIGDDVFLDGNIGIAANLSGSWWLASDIAIGLKF